MSEFGLSTLGSKFPGAIREGFIKNEPSSSIDAGATADNSSLSFMDTLEGVLQKTNTELKAADKASEDLAAGRAESLHSVMIAMEKADLSLRTVNAIRNKMVEAYQEIMRMQV